METQLDDIIKMHKRGVAVWSKSLHFAFFISITTTSFQLPSSQGWSGIDRSGHKPISSVRLWFCLIETQQKYWTLHKPQGAKYLGSGSSWMWSMRTIWRMQKRQRCCNDFTLLKRDTGYSSWTGVGGSPETKNKSNQSTSPCYTMRVDFRRSSWRYGLFSNSCVT